MCHIFHQPIPMTSVLSITLSKGEYVQRSQPISDLSQYVMYSGFPPNVHARFSSMLFTLMFLTTRWYMCLSLSLWKGTVDNHSFHLHLTGKVYMQAIQKFLYENLFIYSKDGSGITSKESWHQIWWFKWYEVEILTLTLQMILIYR